MHKFFKRFAALALLACVPLVFSACGGGESVEMTTISGTATKGPIKGALVQVFRLNGDGTKGEFLGSGVSDGNASYSIAIPKAKAVPPLLVTVTGQSGATYKSETTGAEVPFTAKESFAAALDTFESGKSYTVSPLTDAAYQQLQKFLTESPAATADTRIISAANTRIASLFGVSDILAPPAADPAYSASLAIIDQMVVNSGSGTTAATMNVINQAFVDVTSKPYQTYQAALATAAATVAATVAATDPTSPLIVAANGVASTAAAPPAEPVWTDTTAPKAVINLTAAGTSEVNAVGTATGTVNLAWSPTTTTGKNPVAGYDVWRDGVKIASVTSTKYADKLLALSTSYAYYVVAFDAAGNRSSASSTVTATTPVAPNLTITVGGQLTSGLMSLPFKDITAPSAPTALAATTTAVGATTSTVALKWNAATDNVAVTGYDVYRDGVKAGSATLTSFTDASVTSGVAHSYTVIAFDAAANRSAASTALSVTPVVANLGITIGGQLSSSITGL